MKSCTAASISSVVTPGATVRPAKRSTSRASAPAARMASTCSGVLTSMACMKGCQGMPEIGSRRDPGIKNGGRAMCSGTCLNALTLPGFMRCRWPVAVGCNAFSAVCALCRRLLRAKEPKRAAASALGVTEAERPSLVGWLAGTGEGAPGCPSTVRLAAGPPRFAASQGSGRRPVGHSPAGACGILATPPRAACLRCLPGSCGARPPFGACVA
mmetsp:Transcript_59772/g.185492  ORF Transcript_59772/g.185492 Transcript_59772/m.185492 type:complete len:213 (+) Transcript_59772:739-1377(+)